MSNKKILIVLFLYFSAFSMNCQSKDERSSALLKMKAYIQALEEEKFTIAYFLLSKQVRLKVSYSVYMSKMTAFRKTHGVRCKRVGAFNEYKMHLNEKTTLQFRGDYYTQCSKKTTVDEVIIVSFEDGKPSILGHFFKDFPSNKEKPIFTKPDLVISKGDLEKSRIQHKKIKDILGDELERKKVYPEVLILNLDRSLSENAQAEKSINLIIKKDFKNIREFFSEEDIAIFEKSKFIKSKYIGGIDYRKKASSPEIIFTHVYEIDFQFEKKDLSGVLFVQSDKLKVLGIQFRGYTIGNDGKYLIISGKNADSLRLR